MPGPHESNRSYLEAEKKRFRRLAESRSAGAGIAATPWGRAAERLRRLTPYKEARTVLVSRHPALAQAARNVLADRKYLMMPSPGLQQGFLWFDSGRAPLGSLAAEIGRGRDWRAALRLPYDQPPAAPVDLMVADAVAVGLDGTHVGDGCGHQDLQYAVLWTLGWVRPGLHVIVLVEESRVFESAPAGPNDLMVHWVVTPDRTIHTSGGELPPGRIHWELLEKKQIRRNDALYYLAKRFGTLPR